MYISRIPRVLDECRVGTHRMMCAFMVQFPYVLKLVENCKLEQENDNYICTATILISY